MNLKAFAKHVWPVIPIRIYNQYSKDRSDYYEEKAGDIARGDGYSHLFVVDFTIWEDHIDILL